MLNRNLRPGERLADQKGFTLIELLIVLSLIVILASMGMAQYHSSVVYAKEATLREDIFRMNDAIDQYKAIIKLTDGDDYVTQDLAITILSDEEGHRQQFEGYLKEYMKK